MNQYTSLIISAFIAFLTAVVGFFLGHKKTKAEAIKTEIETVEKAVAIWRQLAQDLKTEVAELRSIVNELKEENDKLKLEVNELKQKR